MPPVVQAAPLVLSLLLLVLALLIGDAAAGLAGRLARGLALAAAALLGALAQVAGLDGLNSLHDCVTPFCSLRSDQLFTR